MQIEEIHPQLRDAAKALGFKELTAIQKESFEAILNGSNVIARSATGTGKTAAFLLPLLQRILNGEKLRVVVLEPSRELVIQAANEARRLSGESVSVLAAYGGTGIEKQQQIAKRAAIIIGTPERVRTLMKDALDASTINVFVLDEADRLLEQPFFNYVRTITSMLPKHQTLLFSVQMQANVRAKAAEIARNATEIKTGTTAGTQVTHEYIISDNPGKTLADILKKGKGQSIIFCHSIESARALGRQLLYHGFKDFTSLHSELKSLQRASAIKRFTAGQMRVLIATDVAARGVHANNIPRVYSIGVEDKFYLHRAGRTGRMGASGSCVSIIAPAELKALLAVYGNLGIQGKETTVA